MKMQMKMKLWVGVLYLGLSGDAFDVALETTTIARPSMLGLAGGMCQGVPR